MIQKAKRARRIFSLLPALAMVFAMLPMSVTAQGTEQFAMKNAGGGGTVETEADTTSPAGAGVTGAMLRGDFSATADSSLVINDVVVVADLLVDTKPEGELWEWDADTATLTLKDGYASGQIWFNCGENDSITLAVEDSATATVTDDSNSILCDGSLKITGGGTLTVRATDTESTGYAINAAQNLKITGGVKVTATSETIRAGISARSVTVDGATVNSSGTYGIYNSTTVNVTNGADVTVTGGFGAFGIVTVTVNDAKLTADQMESGYQTNAINLTVTSGGSNVNITGGIMTDLTVSGGTVKIGGGVGGKLTVSGGAVGITGTVSGEKNHTGGTINGIDPGGEIPKPTITAISPGKGTVYGDTEVTLTGTNFYGATVTIGGKSVVGLNLVSPTEIKFKTPEADAAGTVSVIVTTGGETASTLFTYEGTKDTELHPKSWTVDNCPREGCIFMPKGNPGEPKKKYSGELKQKVVEYMRENRLSCRETGRAFGIKHDQVIAWERIYLEEGTAGLYKERRGRSVKESGSSTGRTKQLDKKVEEDLIAENQRLRMEVDYLKKLNALVQARELQERKRK